MSTQQVGESLCLGFAQLRELGGDVGDRAMVLAELFTDTDLTGRRSVTLPGQRRSEGLGASGGVRVLGDRVLMRADQRGDPSLREGLHRVFPGVIGEEADGRGSEVVVGVPEPGPAGFGQQEVLGGTATSAGAAAGRVPGFGLAVGEQRVEVTADGGGADAQLLGHHDGGHRTLFQQQAGHFVPGPALGADLRGDRLDLGAGHVATGLVPRPRLFHNTSVTYFRGDGKEGCLTEWRGSRPRLKDAFPVCDAAKDAFVSSHAVKGAFSPR